MPENPNNPNQSNPNQKQPPKKDESGMDPRQPQRQRQPGERIDERTGERIDEAGNPMPRGDRK